MRARRALLYVPGSDERKIIKAATLNADSVCLDLEDGVALDRKQEARVRVARDLHELDFGRSERLARINAIGSGLEEDDLAALLPSHPAGIVLPKVWEAEQVRWVDAQIEKFEAVQGWALHGIQILAMIETARGIINLPQIASTTPRLDALIFGAEDFAADVGAVRTREGMEVLYARSAVVTTAAAFGLQAIDLLDTDFQDLERLRQEAQQGARLGFAGKQIIHPNQLQVVQEMFTPSEAAIAQAQRVVQAAAESQARGEGAFALDGKMVDRPIVKAAERLLARARAAGKTSP
jgi:citrate lyase beta subunit